MESQFINFLIYGFKCVLGVALLVGVLRLSPATLHRGFYYFAQASGLLGIIRVAQLYYDGWDMSRPTGDDPILMGLSFVCLCSLNFFVVLTVDLTDSQGQGGQKQ